MNEIRNQFRKISALLSAQAAVASGAKHSGTIGQLREKIVSDFLSPHLPQIFDIKTGFLIDSKGTKSKQQDFVIIDKRLPFISLGSESEALLIAESAVATVEVKSFLNKDELINSLASSEITKSLYRAGVQIYRKGNAKIVSSKPLPILTYLIAFDALDLNTLQDHILNYLTSNEKPGSICFDAICVLNKGVLIRSQQMPTVKGNSVIMPPVKNLVLKTRYYPKDALFAFYHRFIDDIMHLELHNYDLDGYFENANLE